MVQSFLLGRHHHWRIGGTHQRVNWCCLISQIAMVKSASCFCIILNSPLKEVPLRRTTKCNQVPPCSHQRSPRGWQCFLGFHQSNQSIAFVFHIDAVQGGKCECGGILNAFFHLSSCIVLHAAWSWADSNPTQLMWRAPGFWKLNGNQVEPAPHLAAT